MRAPFIVLLVAVAMGASQRGPAPCCKCDGVVSSARPNDAVCLNSREMRDQIEHVEPLKPSGLGRGLNLAGTVVVELRFDPDGKVACFRALGGRPIAVAAAMEAVRKWTFKPLMANGVARAGCGRLTIKYRLRDQGSSTELQ